MQQKTNKTSYADSPSPQEATANGGDSLLQPLTTHHSPLHDILFRHWRYTAFRPLQEEIMQAVLSGHDTLALMPTGGGKSLCYQVPAMAMNGLCLVISPLIALMKDQVENLRKKGITAFAIYAGMKRFEVINILKTASESNCKFLYVSPERLETNLFKEYLPALNIHLVAVDEAHCVSQWGYDFRPPYLRIAQLREALSGVPVLALTASATPDVQRDICEKLAFIEPKIFRQSFERPNLSYSVFKTDSKINRLLTVLNNVSGSSIVYCKSRRRTKEIAAQLQSYHISADYYHAGLTTEDRSKKQEAWITGETRTIVCTNAFGMGIDKPDVRTVVHMDMPDCLENYYQEAGRAGRDTRKSYAVLLYQLADIEDLSKQPALRFPGIASIRRVYQALANYLQLPAGSGEGNYYEFDVTDFIKKFALPAQEVMNVLKVLEQEGFMSFNEQVFLPVRVQFICTRETLFQFENDHPAAEPLIKMLLRSYEGIFDMAVAIFEKQVAGWLKKDIEVVKQLLVMLHGHRIIRYEPQKDTPQLYVLQPRVRAEDLQINHADYKKRKNRFEDRINKFIDYTQNTTDCRSVFTGVYFGDVAMRLCGICDNCLQLKKTNITAADFALIQQRVDTALASGPVAAEALLLQLKGIPREKAWEVIDFLSAEQKITIDLNGLVTKLQ